MAMGEGDQPPAATGAAEKVVAALAGAWLALLPLWAGKADMWRQWLAAAGMLLLAALWTWLRPLRTPRCGWLVLAALVLAAAAMWVSVAPCCSVGYVLFFAACVAALALGFELGRAGLAWAGAGGVAAGGAVCGLWALREYVITASVLGDASWRPFGPFINPNALAGYLVVALPALAVVVAGLRQWAVHQQPGHPSRIAWPPLAFVLALSAVALVLTASKGALGAAVLALIFVGLASRRLRWLAVAGLAAVVVTLLAPPTRTRIAAAFSTQRKTSFAFRVQTWRGTWRMAAARPLTGWGPGAFRHAYPMFALVPFTAMAHSSWLQMAAEAGFPAAAALVAGLVACIAVAATEGRRVEQTFISHAARAASDPRNRKKKARSGRPAQPAGGLALEGLGPAAAVGAAAFVLHNLVDYTWYLPAVALSVLALLGAAVSGRPAQAWGSGKRRRRLWAGAATVAALICLWQGSAAVMARAAAGEARQGFFAGAEERARAAARRAVFCADAWITLGKILEGAAGSPPVPAKLLEAAEAYKQAAEWAPTEPGALIGAARCLRLAGRAAEALKFAGAAAGVYPRGPAALLEYARCLEAAGRQAQALEVYRRIAALADSDYGRFPPLEGWADWRIAVAAAAVARAEKDPARRLAQWRIAGRVLRDYLSWALHYRQPMSLGGRLDPGLLAELGAVAYDAAAALEASGGADDRRLAEKLRGLAERI